MSTIIMSFMATMGGWDDLQISFIEYIIFWDKLQYTPLKLNEVYANKWQTALLIRPSGLLLPAQSGNTFWTLHLTRFEFRL